MRFGALVIALAMAGLLCSCGADEVKREYRDTELMMPLVTDKPLLTDENKQELIKYGKTGVMMDDGIHILTIDQVRDYMFRE